MDEVKISKKLTTEVEHKSEHYDYVQNRIHLNEYLRDNQKQEDNLILSREYAAQALVDKYGVTVKPEQVPVKQRALTDKEIREQKKEREKLMKKTLKKYPAGTENTLDIVKQHTELLMEHNAKMEEISKSNPEYTDEYNKRLILQKELYSYMDEQTKNSSPEPAMQIAEMIKKYDKKFMNKLTPEYVGRNYAEVKSDMDKISCIAKNIEVGNFIPQITSNINGIGASKYGLTISFDFIEFADACQEMYRNALLANGLKINEDNGALSAATTSEQALFKNKNTAAVYRMNRVFRRTPQQNDIEEDIHKYEDFLTKTELEMRKRHNKGEDTTQIESLLFKARAELDLIEAIKDNYENPEMLTKEQREYANMHYPIQDKAYKTEKMTNVCLLKVIEKGVKEEKTDIEATKREINILADTINSNMSVEELGKYREELYRLAAVIIKDEILVYMDSAINEIKVGKILSLERKLRAADIISGIRTNSITLEDLTEEERNSIINNYDGNVTEIDIVEYAKRMGEVAEKQYEQLMNAYILNESTVEISMQRGNDRFNIKEVADKSNHKMVSNKIIEYTREYLNYKNDQLETLYRELEAELNKMISVKEETEETVKIDQIKEKMTYIQILYRLKRIKYRVYGDNEAPQVAPIFRGLNVFENDEFAVMSDEEFLNMAKKLSAGTFEKDVDEDTKEQYAKDNMEGLKILKEKSIARYKRLHEKYGLRILDIDYIQDHYYDVKKDFSVTQDDEQQQAIKGVLDLSNNNDVMLLHLVKFYNDIAYMALAALNTTVMSQTGFDDYKGKIKSKWNESTAKHYAYLKEHEGEIKEL